MSGKLNPQDSIHSSEAREEDLLQLLDIILQMMLLTETIEGFKIRNVYNRQMIKNVLNKALAVIVPIVDRDYPLVFKAGQDDSIKIMNKYEKMIHFIRDFNVPQKEKLIEMIEAYNYEKGVMDATTHRILKKHR